MDHLDSECKSEGKGLKHQEVEFMCEKTIEIKFEKYNLGDLDLERLSDLITHRLTPYQSQSHQSHQCIIKYNGRR